MRDCRSKASLFEEDAFTKQMTDGIFRDFSQPRSIQISSAMTQVAHNGSTGTITPRFDSIVNVFGNSKFYVYNKKKRGSIQSALSKRKRSSTRGRFFRRGYFTSYRRDVFRTFDDDFGVKEEHQHWQGRVLKPPSLPQRTADPAHGDATIV